jgi:hypothetical protein
MREQLWVPSLLVPPVGALLGACVRHFGELHRGLNDPPVPGVEMTQLILMLGGLAAGWGCLAFQRFRSAVVKWLVFAGYPIPMFLVAALINIAVNGVGIEGF